MRLNEDGAIKSRLACDVFIAIVACYFVQQRRQLFISYAEKRRPRPDDMYRNRGLRRTMILIYGGLFFKRIINKYTFSIIRYKNS